MAQSALSNGGRRVCLLLGAGTRMATWFYAMHRSLRLRAALLATIHQAKFVEIKLTERARCAVLDIENKGFWQAMFTLLRAVFPALHVLRKCDSNTPCMEQLPYIVHQTTTAIEKSMKDIGDAEIFLLFSDESVSEEEMQVFGDRICNDDEEANDE